MHWHRGEPRRIGVKLERQLRWQPSSDASCCGQPRLWCWRLRAWQAAIPLLPLVRSPSRRAAATLSPKRRLSAPVARRGAPAAAAPSVRSASNVHELVDTKYVRFERQVFEDAPPPVAVRQLLPRHAEFCRRGWRPRGPLGDQVRVARERRYACLRPTAASSATTARDAAATAG